MTYSLAGKTLRDLGHVETQPEKLKAVQANDEFMKLGRYLDDEEGISLILDPRRGLRLNDGRHRFVAAKEANMKSVYGTIRRPGSGRILFRGYIPLKENILRSFIQEALNERIRGEGFELNTFKRLKTPKECNEYARKYLQYINSGSSRNSYVLSSKKVLKIARTMDYVDQNKREVMSSKNQAFNEFFTRVYDHDHEYIWVISELVNPIDDFKDVCEFFGLKYSQMVQIILYVSRQQEINRRYKKNLPIRLDGMLSNVEDPKRANDFIDLVINASNNDIDINDWIGSDQWGRAQDGRIVLLDYGA